MKKNTFALGLLGLVTEAAAQYANSSSVNVIGADLISLTTNSHVSYSYTYQFLTTIEFEVSSPGVSWFSLPSELGNLPSSTDDSDDNTLSFEYGNIQYTSSNYTVNFTSVPPSGYYNISFPADTSTLDTISPGAREFTFETGGGDYNVTIDYEALPTDKPVLNAQLDASDKIITYFVNIPAEIYNGSFSLVSKAQSYYTFDTNNVNVKFTIENTDPFNDPAGTGSYDDVYPQYLEDTTTSTTLDVAFNGSLSIEYTEGAENTVYSAVTIKFIVDYTDLEDVYELDANLILGSGSDVAKRDTSYEFTNFAYPPQLITNPELPSVSTSAGASSGSVTSSSASATSTSGSVTSSSDSVTSSSGSATSASGSIGSSSFSESGNGTVTSTTATSFSTSTNTSSFVTSPPLYPSSSGLSSTNTFAESSGYVGTTSSTTVALSTTVITTCPVCAEKTTEVGVSTAVVTVNGVVTETTVYCPLTAQSSTVISGTTAWPSVVISEVSSGVYTVYTTYCPETAAPTATESSVTSTGQTGTSNSPVTPSELASTATSGSSLSIILEASTSKTSGISSTVNVPYLGSGSFVQSNTLLMLLGLLSFF